MRHRLPHAWRAGRGMQVLLLPLRAFGDGGAGELVDGGIAARALVNPIAACIDHARYLAIAWNIFAVIPAVPFRLGFGGDGHAANLQYRRHAALPHFQGVREDLLSHDPRQVRSPHAPRHPPSPPPPSPPPPARR